ncbi:uncharacterized protein V6R79_017200 [Siganus canaliculatus]
MSRCASSEKQQILELEATGPTASESDQERIKPPQSWRLHVQTAESYRERQTIEEKQRRWSAESSHE